MTMKSIKKKIAASLVLPVMLAACSAGGPSQPEMPAISADNIKAHMTFLADDAMKGRESGKPEYMIAANYVAAQYQFMGLKPAGDNGSFFQTVNFVSAEVTSEGSSMTLTGGGKTLDLTYGKDFAPWLNMDKLTGSAEAADVVFAGYGSAKELEGLDVAGKIVVVIAGKRARVPSAAAVINLTDAKFLGRARYSDYLDYLTKGSVMMDPTGKAMSKGYGDVIYDYLSPEASAQMVDLIGTDMDSLRAKADSADFKAYTLDIGVKTSVNAKTNTAVNSPNVVGMIEGSDPKLKNEYVIISAHLDHVGEHCRLGLAKDKNDSVCNGAMDNASGTATMMEAARAFASRKAPKRSVVFIALTGEEKGLLGSQYFAAHPTLPMDKIVANVNLDMPILTYNFADVVAFGGEHSTIGEVAETALAKIGVGLAVDPMPEQNLFRRSDHYNFVLKGVPSVFLMSGPNMVGQKKDGEGLEKFEEFLNTNYHSKADDMMQALDFKVAAKFTLANYLIINALANSDERPMWYEGNEYGDKYAPGQKRAIPSERVKARALEAEQVKKARMEKLKGGK